LAKDSNTEHHPAAELLGDWRAAERDAAAAKAAAAVAGLALNAASAAEEAALEAEAAADAALAAATSAKVASDRARKAATQAAQAAQLLRTTAEGDKIQANHAVEETEDAEAAARAAYRDAATEGFPKD
jgi:flagellar motor protein MotB